MCFLFIVYQATRIWSNFQRSFFGTFKNTYTSIAKPEEAFVYLFMILGIIIYGDVGFVKTTEGNFSFENM